MVDLSKKRNGRKINVLYPQGGNKNVLRSVNGVKLVVELALTGSSSLSKKLMGRFAP